MVNKQGPDNRLEEESLEEIQDETESPDEASVIADTEGAQPAADQTVEVAEADPITAELAELKDRHLRLAADFENFRKRTAREKTETWSRAQADVVGSILDAIDDFSRVLETDPGVASTEDVLQGVQLVERKLMRELTSAGLEKIGESGEAFDPNLHEAIGSLPANEESEDQTVGAVFQVGYRFGGTLLRPAKVQVRMWQDGGGE